jgi:phosphoglycerate kinase
MTYNKKSIEDIDVNGKRVFARCDFNIPLDAQGGITDDKRIRESIPTIKYLIDHNAKVVLSSHLGRPKGEFNMKYSLAPVAERLSKLLGVKVIMAKDVIGDDAKAKRAALKTARFSCLKMSASIRKRKKMTLRLQKSLPATPKYS